ncbi:MAG TPA: zf-HC2 domain-containing protein [Actinomycetota bacterium]|nr:zf-HC2 domain-containing protein [Actinomycetota bacterium]
MRCEDALGLLPDFALGTLSEHEEAAVRRHLRGCGACRADAASLDEGVAMFAEAAHAMDPPAELKHQVMTVLTEEWKETPDVARPSRRRALPWLAVAAAVVALAGALTWGATARSDANRASLALRDIRGDAASYQAFLHALGGKDVRVAKLAFRGPSQMEGTAILYDSDRGQSWGLVEVTAPGYTRPLTVTLLSSTGRTITLPGRIEFDSDGHGATWLVTSANITTFDSVRLTAPDGEVVATGTTRG